jgi:hypothetical protein
MTDAEKAAMEWLEGWVGLQSGPLGEVIDIRRAAEHARTLKAMLAGAGYHAAPRTKEVWRLQPEGWPFEDFTAIYTATARAAHWLAQGVEVSIRKMTVLA